MFHLILCHFCSAKVRKRRETALGKVWKSGVEGKSLKLVSDFGTKKEQRGTLCHALPYLPGINLADKSLDCLFAVFGIGQRLYKPKFAVLYELGVIAAARNLSVNRMNMT